MRTRLTRLVVDAPFFETPRSLFDGWDQLQIDWRPRTLVLEVRSTTASPPNKWSTVQPVGQVATRLCGLVNGGEYLRDFSLGLWQSVRLDLASFQSARFQVVSSTLFPCAVVATLCEEPLLSPADPLLLLPVTYTAIGTFGVPAGATEVVTSLPDAGWNWLGADVDGTGIAIPSAAVAGVPRPVEGIRFSTTAPNSAVWRIKA